MRRGIYWGVAVLVFAALNVLVAQKEATLRSGQTVLIRLAPVDPRSLVQGDYMRLRYDLSSVPGLEARFDRPFETADAPEPVRASRPADGHLVYTLDENRVATFLRAHAGEPLAPGEFLIRFRRRGEIRLGAESFFFQEGQAPLYEGARYGELKVSPGGDSILVGLRDENFQRLGPADGR